MKYLNILLILVIIGLCVAPLLAEQQTSFGTYSHSESNIDCHCEAHEQLKKNITYIIDCSTSDKITRKSMIQARIIPAYPVLISSNLFIYTIDSPVGDLLKDTYLSVDTPPPKLA